MAPPHRHDERNRRHPYPHQHHHGGRQDSSRNHGGQGRGGQGWDHSRRQNGQHGRGNDASYGNRAHYTNNRPEDTGRGRDYDGQARAARHDNDDHARLPERRFARDMVEPQLQTSRVESEQQDDGNVAAADESKNPDASGTPFQALVHEQNDDEGFDPDTPFEKMNYMQKLIAQIPGSEDEWQFKKNLQNNPNKDKRFGERKELIVAEMVKELREGQEAKKQAAPLEELEDEDEIEERAQLLLEDPDGGNWERNQAIDWETERIETFILALPSCLLLTAGFCVLAGSVRCFCPCSAKMDKWRKLAKCSYNDEVCSKKGDYNDPNGLMDHIGEKAKSDILHKEVKKYLERLFADYCAPNLSHRGLYKKGSSDYEKALAQEKLQDARTITNLQKHVELLEQREAEQQKAREDEIKLEEVNPDKAEMLKDVSFPDESPMPSLDSMLPHYEKQLVAFWSMLNVSHKKVAERSIEVKHNFSLQEEFEKWHKSNKKRFPYTFLFHDPKDIDVQKFLSSPRIVYAVDDALKPLSAKVKKEEQAVDKGGPVTQFFSQVWHMMPQLKVSAPDGSKSIALFETTDCGYSPMTNVVLDRLNSPELLQQAKLYYRALGRLFVNCLSMRRTIPDEVLPALFRNAIMRECMPTSPDYCVKALCTHVLALGWSKATIKLLKDEGGETHFRKVVLEKFINTRSLWFDSFKEGVTLKGCAPISLFYSLIPLQAVNHLTFGTQEFTAQDVIDRLVAKYKGDDIIQATQKLLFNNESKKGTLSDVLMNLEKEHGGMGRPWLQCFVEFCTGQWYLPHCSEHFTIQVAFELRNHEKDSEDEDRIPASYTCSKELCFPLQAYDGNRETLEEKLKKSVEYSENTFSMH